MKLLYVMDPMCAWCYGFQPELEQLLSKYLDNKITWVMGGLAPDTNIPMDNDLKQTIASYWYQIEQRSQVSFNHDYWQKNTPYRSTFIACRAVIAAEQLQSGSSQSMAKAIQSAYYQQAQNPSLEGTLIACAETIGLDKKQFAETLKSEHTEQQLQQHFSISRQLQVSGFPALFYIDDANRITPIALGYCTKDDLEQRLSIAE